VELGDKLVGDLVMSGGCCIIQVSDDPVDFGEANRGIVGGRAIMSFDKISWE
jgi:hypothetical protein